jgi:hypothetical protein
MDSREQATTSLAREKTAAVAGGSRTRVTINNNESCHERREPISLILKSNAKPHLICRTHVVWLG